MSAGSKTILGGTGRPVTVAADGSTEWLPIGAGIDWDSVSAAGADTILEDDTPIKAGEKYLRYGTVLVYSEGTKAVQTVDADALDTSDTFDLTVSIGGQSHVFNFEKGDSDTDVQAALKGVFGDLIYSVSETSNVYTITFSGRARDIEEITSTNSDITVAVTTAESDDGGLWVEWDKGDNLEHGYVGILNQTIKLSEPTFHTGYWDEDLQGLIRGGLVWRERIDATGAALGYLLAALPRLYLTPKQ